LEQLETQNPEGYALFQIKTAALIIALQCASGSSVVAAAEDESEACKANPGKFINDVLDAPEHAPFLGSFNPAKLAALVLEHYIVTGTGRAMVEDLSTAREMAVKETMAWLVPMGVTGSVNSIAKAYHIVQANQDLRAS
jgi:hypothetical protein